MPRVITYADPNASTTIGASFQVARVAVGASGVQVVYNANNGDAPIEFTAADMTAAERTALQAVHDACVRILRAARAYT